MALKQEVLDREAIIKIKVFTWNIEGKGHPEDVDKAIAETFIECPDVVCLQEANLPTPGEGTTNYKWLCTGAYGAAVLISKTSSVKYGSFDRLRDEICVAELICNDDKKVKVISCYVPPSSDYRSEELWTTLTELLKTIPTNMAFILAGDFNAQVGRSGRSPADKICFGEMLHHYQSNDNGVKFKSLACAAHLVAVNTFKRRLATDYSVVTYKSDELQTQQDYLVMPNLRNALTEDICTKWHKEYNHAMLGCQLTVLRMEYVYNLGPEEDIQRKLTVSTWNIQGATPAKVDQVLSEHSLPVVCVQGIFVTSDEDLSTDHYKWLHSKKQWAKNVGILVRTSPEIKVTKFEALSECLCVSDISFYEKEVKVISCFLPPVGSPRYEEVSVQLLDTLKQVPKDTLFVVGGDFSIKLMRKEVDEKNKNSNLAFMQKLMAETNIGFTEVVWKQWEKSLLPTEITETDIRHPHLLLMPVTFLDKLPTKMFIRRVPFNSNGICSLLIGNEADFDKPQISLIEELDDNDTVTEPTTKITDVDFMGIVKHYHFDDSDEEVTVKLPSAETVEKYKDTPVPDKEVKKLLKNFVIYHKANNFSTVNTTIPPMIILFNSFRDGKYGKLTAQEVQVVDEQGIQKKNMHIRWNGVLLLDVEGTKEERTKALLNRAGGLLIAKLSQFYQTVVAKPSFYNQGLLPVLDGTPKLRGMLVKVTKAELPLMFQVTKHIDKFFSVDHDRELVFGEDFNKVELKRIEKYAKSHKLGYRMLRLTQGKTPRFVKTPHSIALFKKRTPQLLKVEVDRKYNAKYLMITYFPKGTAYQDILSKIDTVLKRQQRKDENMRKLNQKYEIVPDQGNTIPPWEQQQYDNFIQKCVNQPQELKNSRGRGGGRVWDEPPPLPDVSGVSDPLSTAALLLNNALLSVMSGPAGPAPMEEPPLPVRDQAEHPEWYSDHLVSLLQREENALRRFSNARGGVGGTILSDIRQEIEMEYEFCKRRHDQRLEEMNAPPNGRDRPPRNESPRGYSQNRGGGGKRQFSWMNSSRDEQPPRSQERGGYPSKRQRLEDLDSALPCVNIPDWRDLAPLIIVYPITICSTMEERPAEVLKANFPTQFVSGPENMVAVVVGLPLRNGCEKDFCLAVDVMPRAVQIALHRLSAHGTIIKPNPHYLCNGGVPEFVRHRIPCQENPRTYIMLSEQNTGPMTEDKIIDIFRTFKESFNEEIFFGKNGYTSQEKQLIMRLAGQFDLNVRHFGDASDPAERFVCVYKDKSKQGILDEVKSKRERSRYIICPNKYR